MITQNTSFAIYTTIVQMFLGKQQTYMLQQKEMVGKNFHSLSPLCAKENMEWKKTIDYSF